MNIVWQIPTMKIKPTPTQEHRKGSFHQPWHQEYRIVSGTPRVYTCEIREKSISLPSFALLSKGDKDWGRVCVPRRFWKSSLWGCFVYFLICIYHINFISIYLQYNHSASCKFSSSLVATSLLIRKFKLEPEIRSHLSRGVFDRARLAISWAHQRIVRDPSNWSLIGIN